MTIASKKKIIAIAGGIGSGKSVVSDIIRIMGFDVYDCDAEAKRLMNTSEAIKNDLVSAFGADAITEQGEINRPYISSVVFGNQIALNKINSIVHPRVKDDILDKMNRSENDILFVETAILMQSNLLDIINGALLVTAPKEVRVERVMKRNGIAREDVLKRIEAQEGQDYSKISNLKVIENDGIEAVLPQVVESVCSFTK